MLCTCDTGLDLDDLDMFDADEYVPEVSQYTLVYKLGMPNKVDFRYKDYYSESPSVETEFTLIAYYVQLIDYQKVFQWVKVVLLKTLRAPQQVLVERNLYMSMLIVGPSLVTS